jgi:hypothetical protein
VDGETPAAADEDRQPGLEQGRNDRPITTFDRHTTDDMPAQNGHQPGQAGGRVLHGQAFHDRAVVVDHTERVLGPGPVHPGVTTPALAPSVHFASSAVSAVEGTPVGPGTWRPVGH